MRSSENTVGTGIDNLSERNVHGAPLENLEKSRWERSWPTIACGAGLFSDGYLNGYAVNTSLGAFWARMRTTDRYHRVIGSVNTMLGTIYPKQYKASSATRNVSSIAFAGTVVGQLLFGYTSDHYSRKWSLLVSTVLLMVFAALCAGSYGYHGSVGGLFAALTAFRFLLGIGIG